jgi:hypothetical protein
MKILIDVADKLRTNYGRICSKRCMESLLAALCFSTGLPINTFSNLNRWGAKADGQVVLYIMGFDETGFERGEKGTGHNKRVMGTSSTQMGTNSTQMGTNSTQQQLSKAALGTSTYQKVHLCLIEDLKILSTLNAKRNFQALDGPARKQEIHSYYTKLKKDNKNKAPYKASASNLTKRLMGRMSKRAKLYDNRLGFSSSSSSSSSSSVVSSFSLVPSLSDANINSWTCVHCTFLNKNAEFLACGICAGARRE